ncbi:sugar phosphate isomerase/epimerase family protein [Flavimarina sp. Hel_I_48]|uniref:sugar phosphate isomerase/epimerase family protein n=1 Tax=Flavimarina sp. Hel_I_48 TaxID=1392488 RepID=UPI0004DF7378|nr:sugar phosphate isomerase/epimerase family protein [Flavimarina sp. Hel_I_48]
MSQKLRFAYNTNGCNNHRLNDALDLIAEAGYDGVALTLDWQHLDPFAEDWQDQSEKLKERLHTLGLGCVIETGARYLLNPREKHEPTFLNPLQEGRDHRLAFLKRAVDIAAILDAEAVSFWAGVKQEQVQTKDAWNYLKTGMDILCAYAEMKKVTLALEPEPGMLIETLADLEQLNKELTIPLPLALDVGHVWVTGEMDPDEAVRQHVQNSATAAIEGMNKGVHIHLPVTEGDMDVPKIIAAFKKQDYDKLICVELSRESHRAHKAIFESIAALRKMEME